MARGWESKSVESQMESAEERRALREQPVLTEQEKERLAERSGLELTRTRVLKDLAAATNPRYRLQLEAALAHIDAKLSDIDPT